MRPGAKPSLPARSLQTASRPSQREGERVGEKLERIIRLGSSRNRIRQTSSF